MLIPNRTRHILKTDAEPFCSIWDGHKRAEFRAEDNRLFWVGDRLDLLEQTEPGRYTGRTIIATVTHVQRGYGIPTGYAMVSFSVVSRNKRQDRQEIGG